MTYRIELERTDMPKHFSRGYDYNEYAYSSDEVRIFIKECVPEGFRVAKIVKTTKDGRGYDVSKNYLK